MLNLEGNARLYLHVGISDVLEGHKGLLDGLCAGPLEHVVGAACLVVGPRQPGAPEGLLPDHGAGGLVVDVEVSSCSSQNHCCAVGEFSAK